LLTMLIPSDARLATPDGWARSLGLNGSGRLLVWRHDHPPVGSAPLGRIWSRRYALDVFVWEL